MTFASYSQNFEDVVLWRALRHVTPGTYIDIGAQDPERESVSLAFYKAGWRGVHVEATSAYAAKLRAARTDEIVIEAAVTDAPGPIEFYEIPDTGLSTGKRDIADMHTQAGWDKRSILVPTIRLDGIFQSLSGREVHWLKIDVEGMEADVLRSWGAHPARPWVLVIEATIPTSQEQSHAEWVGEVLGRGYREVLFDGLSRYFLHEDHLDLLPSIELPANIFDWFAIGRDHFAAVHLKDELQALEHDLAALRAELPIREQEHAATLAELTSASEARVVAAHEEAADARAKLEQAFVDEIAGLQKSHEQTRAHLEHRFKVDLATARDEFSKYRAEQELALRAAHEELVVARIDNARLDERSIQLLERVETAQRAHEHALQERDHLNEQIAALHGEARDLQQNLTGLEIELALSRDALQRAGKLIRAAGAVRQRRLDWLKLGLGLSKPPSAWRDLEAWTSESNGPAMAQASVQQHADGDHTTMTVPAFTNGNPYLRAESLPELLAWNDLDFVRCAYVTILGRQPDPMGEAHFANRLRIGDSKLALLWNLRRSDEGRRHDPGIAGLDRALRREARRRSRLIGWLVRLLRPGEGLGRADRRSRQLNNMLLMIVEQQKRQASALENYRDRDQQLSHQLENIAGALRDLKVAPPPPPLPAPPPETDVEPEQEAPRHPHEVAREHFGQDEIDLSVRERAIVKKLLMVKS